jgi:hypothetical protein
MQEQRPHRIDVVVRLPFDWPESQRRWHWLQLLQHVEAPRQFSLSAMIKAKHIAEGPYAVISPSYMLQRLAQRWELADLVEWTVTMWG